MPSKDNKDSDDSLVNLYYETHDIRALGILFADHMDLIYGVCLKYCDNPEDAQDFTMNIFFVLLDKLKEYKVSNFKGWLYHVTKNYCLTVLKTKKHYGSIEMNNERLFIDATESDKALNFEENSAILKSCLEKLKLEQRTVIELFYFDNQCYDQIVDLTGFEWNQVRSHIQNGKVNLRKCIERKKEHNS